MQRKNFCAVHVWLWSPHFILMCKSKHAGWMIYECFTNFACVFLGLYIYDLVIDHRNRMPLRRYKSLCSLLCQSNLQPVKEDMSVCHQNLTPVRFCFNCKLQMAVELNAQWEAKQLLKNLMSPFVEIGCVSEKNFLSILWFMLQNYRANLFMPWSFFTFKFIYNISYTSKPPMCVKKVCGRRGGGVPG